MNKYLVTYRYNGINGERWYNEIYYNDCLNESFIDNIADSIRRTHDWKVENLVIVNIIKLDK